MDKVFIVFRKIIQFIGFVIIRIVYEPLNKVIVNKFGCGCKDGFNANTINTFLTIIVYLLFIIVSILNISIYKKKLVLFCVLLQY